MYMNLNNILLVTSQRLMTNKILIKLPFQAAYFIKHSIFTLIPPIARICNPCFFHYNYMKLKTQNVNKV